MIYPLNNIDYNLPNGELIGGYISFKGFIKEIEKYKDNILLKKYSYSGPIPLFIVPIGNELFEKINSNNGIYIGFNRCFYFNKNMNCQNNQKCKCYCGQCCNLCNCKHNNINEPNFPLGEIFIALKTWILEYYKSLEKYDKSDDENYENLEYLIEGKKGIFKCFFNDENGNGYKIDIKCEQELFPNEIIPKGGYVDILTVDKKKIKLKTNFFEELVDYFDEKYNSDDENEESIPKYNREESEEKYKIIKKKVLKKKRKRKTGKKRKTKRENEDDDDDEDYEPTSEEFQEEEEEDEI